MLRRMQSSRGQAIGVITLVTFVTHALVLLNGGIFWDGAVVYLFKRYEDMPGLINLFDRKGLIEIGYIHEAVLWLPHYVFFYKLFTLLCVLFSGIVVYLISEKLRLLTQRESILLALIFVTFPAYRPIGEVILFPYSLTFLAFLWAIYLSLQLPTVIRWWIKLGLRLGAFFLFFTSFTIGIFLPIYLAALIVLLVYYLYDHPLTLKSLVRFGIQRADFCALPIVYWGLASVIDPNTGYKISSSNITGNAYWRAFRLGIVYYFEAVTKQPWWMLSLILIVALSLLWWLKHRQEPHPAKTGIFLLFFTVITFLLGVTPYVMSGKVFEVYSWQTRNNLLMGLYVSLFTLAIYRLAISSRSNIYIQRIGLLMATFLIIAFSVLSIKNYLAYQARYVKDLSISHNLRQIDTANTYTAYWFYDTVPPKSVPDRYYALEISMILDRTWDDRFRIGNSFVDDDHTTIKHDFGVTGGLLGGKFTYNPKACQTAVMILPGSMEYDETKLALQYWKYHFFEPSKLDPFLASVTTVAIQPISGIDATECEMSVTDPIVFNPSTNTTTDFGAFMVYAFENGYRFETDDDPELMDMVVKHMVYEPQLLRAHPKVADLIAEWRLTKNPQPLIEAGVDYLYIEPSWLAWTTPEEYTTLFESENYEITHKWRDPIRQKEYYLLRPIPS